MDRQPTEERIKELWEWCGWRLRPDAPKLIYTGDLIWLSPEKDKYEQNQYFQHLPILDLNNLFKYAVPKLGLVTISIYPDKWIDKPTGWCAEIKSNSDKHPLFKRASEKDPALALFRTIWEVIHGK